jgi:hypothetical protein
MGWGGAQEGESERNCKRQNLPQKARAPFCYSVQLYTEILFEYNVLFFKLSTMTQVTQQGCRFFKCSEQQSLKFRNGSAMTLAG